MLFNLISNPSTVSELTVNGNLILQDASSNKTTIQEGASGNITLTLPASTGTVALTSDIGFVAPTTVVGSAAISDMTSNISKKYVHTGGAVTLKFPNVTASSNLGDTWVVVNAGTDTLTFDRVSASQFKKLNGSTVASLANTVTLSEGGVAELTVTADNQIIIFGSGVI
jgi:D-serine deaminase-like pyridoxal phosphate-dependent protein